MDKMKEKNRFNKCYQKKKKRRLDELMKEFEDILKSDDDSDSSTYSSNVCEEKIMVVKKESTEENKVVSLSPIVSDDSDSDAQVEMINLEQELPKDVTQLKEWIVKSRVPHNQVDNLLKILKCNAMPNLPNCTKTLLQSSTCKFNIESMKVADGSTGEFYYFGIKHKLETTVNPELHNTNLLELIVNIDGMSPFNSSAITIWPTLIKVFTNEDFYDVFCASIYAGRGKPKHPNDYLVKFVKEMNELQSSGITIQDKHFDVKLKFFVCDSPARAYLKCVVGHAAFKGCERCKVIGQKVDNVTVFLGTNSDSKTDEEFRSYVDPDYHTGVSILTMMKPPINMLMQFVIDPMHLLYLGCTKRVLEYLLSTSSHKVRLSEVLKLELTRRTKDIQKDIPEEFPRKMRAMDDHSKYKAVEYKFFILYAAPIILKKLISEEVYNHLMLYTVACRLLSGKDPVSHINEAKTYLKTFVEQAPSIYGSTFVSLNIHNLLHVSDDVETTDCNLNQLSAFAFESHLGTISDDLRSPKHLIAQYCKRQHEKDKILSKLANVCPELVILVQHGNQVLKINYKKMILSNSHPNNIILLKDGSIAQISQFKYVESEIYIETNKYVRKQALFSYPCDSSLLNIWEVNKLSSATIIFPLEYIKNKVVKFEINFSAQEERRLFVVPLLH